jgi:hypothetical protein
MIRSRKMMGAMRNILKILVGKPEGNRAFGRLWHR